MTHKDNSPRAQAEWYADRVKATGSKTLYFWPRRSTTAAFSEQFRYHVLARLLQMAPGLSKAGLDELDAAAQSAGYTIVEIPTRDYQPKSIRADIASGTVSG